MKPVTPCLGIMCPEEDMFSDYQKKLMKQANIKVNKNHVKLVPHLMEKHSYCIHYRNLKYVIDIGVQVTKVHNIINFKQKPWLKQYIKFNTQKRKSAKNSFGKYVFQVNE